MSKTKLMFVFGTRPEAIKMAPVINEFSNYPNLFKIIVCVTGQHKEMLDQVLTLFNIKPDYNLNIMKANQDLFDITGAVLSGMKNIFNEILPDYIFVHGDTLTSTAAAWAAFFKKIPVVHIEAGLRTYNTYNPWPEEMNRQLTGRLASIHFAPTELAKQQLINEQILPSQIFVTGNTVIDALFSVLKEIENNNPIEERIKLNLKNFGYDVNRLTENKKLILITGHRRENFGEGFINICNALKALSINYQDVDFVYPVHLNPNVQRPVYELLNSLINMNIFLIPPLDYLPFVYLMNKSYLILTDSGGVQEEAPSLGKPVLVMRTTTERPEAVEAGGVRLVGTSFEKIVENVKELLEQKSVYLKMSNPNNPYGNGDSSKIIVDVFLKLLEENDT